MLTQDFKERVNQLVHPRFEEFRAQIPIDITIMGNTMALQGLSSSGAYCSAIHEVCEKQIEERVICVWDAIHDTLVAQRTTFSDTLAADLKSLLEHYIPPNIQELSDIYAHHVYCAGGDTFLTQFPNKFAVKRERELQKANAKIDLHLDSLKTSLAANPEHMSAKEYDQKAGILLSPSQAAKDFDYWQRELDPKGRPISVMYIDIDNFKPLNTRYLESIIDQTLLPELMQLIWDSVYLRGGVYREGGDEFVVVLPNQDVSEATSLAERIRSTLADHTFYVNEKREKLTASVGVSSWPQYGGSYLEVLQQANNAMRNAKQSKNTVTLFEPDSPSP